MFAVLRNPYSHLVFTGDKKEGEPYALEILQDKLRIKHMCTFFFF